jgi:hypothetical protein
MLDGLECRKPPRSVTQSEAADCDGTTVMAERGLKGKEAIVCLFLGVRAQVSKSVITRIAPQPSAGGALLDVAP